MPARSSSRQSCSAGAAGAAWQAARASSPPPTSFGRAAAAKGPPPLARARPRDAASAGFHSEGIQRRTTTDCDSRLSAATSRHVLFKFGCDPRPLVTPRTRLMLSTQKSTRFFKFFALLSACRTPSTSALPSPRNISTACCQRPLVIKAQLLAPPISEDGTGSKAPRNTSSSTGAAISGPCVKHRLALDGDLARRRCPIHRQCSTSAMSRPRAAARAFTKPSTSYLHRSETRPQARMWSTSCRRMTTP